MVDKKTVERVLALARIEVAGEQKDYLAGQVAKILDYIDKLKELDVENVEPLRGMHVEQGLTRADQVKPVDCRQDILANAALTESGYIKIPKVIE